MLIFLKKIIDVFVVNIMINELLIVYNEKLVIKYNHKKKRDIEYN